MDAEGSGGGFDEIAKSCLDSATDMKPPLTPRVFAVLTTFFALAFSACDKHDPRVVWGPDAAVSGKKKNHEQAGAKSAAAGGSDEVKSAESGEPPKFFR